MVGYKISTSTVDPTRGVWRSVVDDDTTGLVEIEKLHGDHGPWRTFSRTREEKNVPSGMYKSCRNR